MFANCNELGPLEARYEAQRIAFGPVVFQIVRAALLSGLLERLVRDGDQNLSKEDLVRDCRLSPYAVTVLLESLQAANIVIRTESGYQLTAVGRFLVRDPLTRVNFDFVADVCYRGMDSLLQALETEKPVGLREFGSEWSTVYTALPFLPEQARKSWFAFDHYYSDTAFPALLKIVFSRPVHRLLDIGGNTGRWARQCVAYDPNIRVTIADLPETVKMALGTTRREGIDRVDGCEVNVLQPTAALPTGFDAVWMSQFLCCFSPVEIHHILKLASKAVRPGGTIYVNDTFWDRQKHEIAAYCIINTSPYFTAMANGNSKMYSGEEMEKYFQAAGLKVSAVYDGLGYGHTLYALSADL